MTVKEVPIWEKALLNIEEAAAYTNIGTKKLRRLTRLPMCSFVIHSGNKTLIKRKELLEYLSRHEEI